ncbi:unnamed protein product [Arctia plantaginis]|uniref:Peptidase S1 domain-containing protein n=1 Tax=Arctia plantaginis TaxID=874455 RepID=A0A8S1A9Y3_ARCPL|nr:unnamed protein product [Arctia plantaginis]CAB3253826.1 unnamed protein product [Arctia plantaginis]
MSRSVLLFIVILTKITENTLNSYELVQPVEYYPFFVAILYYFSEKHLLRQCTGSVIKSHIVLTSSHCLQVNVGFIEYDLSTKPKELSSTSERKLKKVIKMIRPKRRGNKPKFVDEIATVGLLVITPFLLEDDMEIYGSVSLTENSHIGQTLIFAGLRPLELPKGFKGTHVPDPDVFTGMGTVVKCPAMNSIYGCIRENGYEMPARSGGPVMNGDEIVGVINQHFKFGSMELTDTFTFIRVAKYKSFIDEESKAAQPNNKSFSSERKSESPKNIRRKKNELTRISLRLNINTSF